MWRPMRRSGQQLPDKETETILACGREGVLAVTDSEGWPYAVPVNYCWKDGKIIIHSGRPFWENPVDIFYEKLAERICEALETEPAPAS